MIESIIDNPLLCVFFGLVTLYFIVNFIVDNFTVSTAKRKHVLVTGCDSGFGYVTALKLSASNCKVYAGCLTQNGVDELQTEKGFEGIAFIMDVTKDEDVDAARQRIEADGGVLDGVVNNAGISIWGLIEWQSVDLMKKTMEVNFWGMVRVTKAMLPLLKMSRGRVVNLTSIGGRISSQNNCPYFASKYAAEAFSDSLRLEMRPWNVSVHIIEPMFYKTPLINYSTFKKSWNSIYDKQPAQVKEEFSKENLDDFSERLYNSFYLTKDPGEVADRIRHALLSRVPRRRYVVGKLCNLGVILTHLPTVVQDFWVANSVPIMIPDALKKEK